MSQGKWTAVDEYVGGLLAQHDEALDVALRVSVEAGLPEIQVSPPQGKLLQLLAQTLRGSDGFGVRDLGWLQHDLVGKGASARRLPDHVGGRSGVRGGCTREHQARRLGDVVELRVGPALETLPLLDAEGAGPFDLTFIDADKANTPEYFAWALDHSHPGSLIVADNVVRDGTLADGGSDDPKVKAQRRLHEMIAAEPRVNATTIKR